MESRSAPVAIETKQHVDDAEPAILLENVSYIFDAAGGQSKSHAAIRGVTLRVEPGEFISVVGPTGCGKSTLLNIVAGLLEPIHGSVRIFGLELKGMNTSAGYVFQSEPLMPWRSALENIIAGLEFRGVQRKQAVAEAEDWLHKVGLSGMGDRYPHQLSGGMRKRVCLAQTLILDPPIVLMDEPFSALDIQTRQLMENELLDLWSARKKTVLFVTHDLDEAIAMSDRVIVLSAGPGAHPIGEFVIDLPRPRDVVEVRAVPGFVELHTRIWAVLREEVLKSYAQGKNA